MEIYRFESSSALTRSQAMRSQSIIGVTLIVVGVLLLAVRSFTYYSEDVVSGPLGFFAWNVERPHTIFISPIAGLVAVATGIGLLVTGRRQGRA